MYVVQRTGGFEQWERRILPEHGESTKELTSTAHAQSWSQARNTGPRRDEENRAGANSVDLKVKSITVCVLVGDEGKKDVTCPEKPRRFQHQAKSDKHVDAARERLYGRTSDVKHLGTPHILKSMDCMRNDGKRT